MTAARFVRAGLRRRHCPSPTARRPRGPARSAGAPRRRSRAARIHRVTDYGSHAIVDLELPDGLRLKAMVPDARQWPRRAGRRPRARAPSPPIATTGACRRCLMPDPLSSNATATAPCSSGTAPGAGLTIRCSPAPRILEGMRAGRERGGRSRGPRRWRHGGAPQPDARARRRPASAPSATADAATLRALHLRGE